MTWPPPRWEQRFRAGRVRLPTWAADNPDRAVVVMTDDGALQVHSWTPSTGDVVVMTARPSGTTHALIDPPGKWVWWFDDTDGDEYGVWRRAPFSSTTTRRPETPIDLPASYPAGLLLGTDSTVIIGRSDAAYGTQIHAVTVGPAGYGTDAPVRLYSHAEHARAAALSRDNRLVAIEHSEHGDARHPSVRVVRRDGWTHAELHDGGGRGLRPLAFSPVESDHRLLIRHERTGTPGLLIWDVDRLLQRPVELGLEGEVAGASWYPDGRHLLVAIDHHARTRSYRFDTNTGEVVGVGSAEGTVAAATARPDGDVWQLHSSSAQPRRVISAWTGTTLIEPPGPLAPPSVPVTDVWVDGPGGRIHALLRVPEGASAPYPVIVEAHGGPTWHDSDSFSERAAAWLDHGWAVLEVNYRGSTGYGASWRDALDAKVGFTELADIAAVHDHLVAEGTLDPARSVLLGASWGGYLSLLGAGTQPDRWTAVVAGVPVADYVAAYEDEMESLKAFDRALFGGSPAERPDDYRESSPITYVDEVRAPVLILAGENDPRCPYRQIVNYVGALQAVGGTVETYVYDAGHGSLVDDERVRQMRAELDFVHRHISPPNPDGDA